MREVDGKRSTTWSQDNPGAAAGPGPGKRTLTELPPAPGAPVQQKVDVAAPVMRDAAGPTLHDLFGGVQRKASGGEPDAAAIHDSAQRGVATASSPLPHAEAIQRSFGGHSISGVQAHTGADAAASARAMGAQAYATGNHVVLDRTDLHTVAHEAAHVVQQRGGVQLKGGVGDAGDAYERQADEAADRVVRGESAEDVLGPRGSDSAARGSRTVQRQPDAGAVSPAPQVAPVTTVTNQITDGPYGWQSKFEVTQSGTEYRVVIKPKLVPDAGVTPAQVADVKQRARAAFTRLFDNKFILTDTVSHTKYNLRAEVQFVDSGEHYSVALHVGPDGNGNLTNWYTGNHNETLAHELGHQLGLKDEYIDATAPDRATAASPGVHTDHSIMGNYLAEGRPAAGAQLRHGQTIGNEIGGATGRSFTIARRP
jgi:Domain of unknown function (DUF4157)